MNIHKSKIIVLFIFSLIILLGYAIHKDYGIGIDEPINRKNGIISLNYVVNKFNNLDNNNYFKNKFSSTEYNETLQNYKDQDYGVVLDLLLIIVERLLEINDTSKQYEMRHLVTFIIFILGAIALYRISTIRFNSWKNGLVSVLILITSPRIFAESFYNNKDIVFMSVFIIAVYTMIKSLKKPVFLNIILHALVCSVVINVRIAGIIIPIITIIFFILFTALKKISFNRFIQLIIIYSILLICMTIILWPWLWSNPIEHFKKAVINMSKFRWIGWVQFNGSYYPSDKLPWTYIPIWMLISTPILYTVMFAIGLVNIIKTFISSGKKLLLIDNNLQDIIFLSLFFSVPIAAIILNSVLYNGWRHLYFTYPFFILIATNGIVFLLKYLNKYYISKVIFYLIFISNIIFLTNWMIRVHPFQNVYFNNIAGKQWINYFETDYWGLSTTHALKYILSNDKCEKINIKSQQFLPLEYSILMLAPNEKQRLNIVNKNEDADYLLTHHQFVNKNESDLWKDQSKKYEKFHDIKVDNEIIFSIYKNPKED